MRTMQIDRATLDGFHTEAGIIEDLLHLIVDAALEAGAGNPPKGFDSLCIVARDRAQALGEKIGEAFAAEPKGAGDAHADAEA